MKRFLGIICIVYSFIIIYAIVTNSLNNYLAPNMQMYIKLSILPLIIMGLVMLINNNINYNFKISDLILLLPLLLIFLASDGRLSSNFASNRALNLNNIEYEKIEYEKIEDTVVNENNNLIEDIEENQIEKDIDNTKEKTIVDFDIVDESYEYFSNYLLYNKRASKQIGKTIRLRGFIVENSNFTDEYAILGKYAISCCAADATLAGFILKQSSFELKINSWYEIEGIITSGKSKSNIEVLTIDVTSATEIDSKDENQYVYPCYSYEEACSEISKYNLD